MSLSLRVGVVAVVGGKNRGPAAGHEGTLELSSRNWLGRVRPTAASVALMTFVIGLIGLYLISGFWHPKAMQDGMEDRWEADSREVALDLCSTLIELGLLTIGFEIIADRSRRQVVKETVSTLFDNRIPQIADLAAKAVAAESSYVESLSPNARKEHLAAFIRGGLSKDAEQADDFVERAARELSGETRYHDYTATFRCSLREPNEVGSLNLNRSYRTNKKPGPQIYRFTTVARDARKPPLEVHNENSFTWVFRLPPGRTHKEMHDQFKLERVLINQYECIVKRSIEPKSTHEALVCTSEYSAALSETDDGELLEMLKSSTQSLNIEVDLTAPLVRDCLYLVYPGSVTRSYTATCIFDQVEGLSPMPVDFLGGASTTIDERPSPEKATSIIISTTGWIMPSAGAGFAFYGQSS